METSHLLPRVRIGSGKAGFDFVRGPSIDDYKAFRTYSENRCFSGFIQGQHSGKLHSMLDLETLWWQSLRNAYSSIIVIALGLESLALREVRCLRTCEPHVTKSTLYGSRSQSQAVYRLTATTATLCSRSNLRLIQLHQITVTHQGQHIPNVSGVELSA